MANRRFLLILSAIAAFLLITSLLSNRPSAPSLTPPSTPTPTNPSSSPQIDPSLLKGPTISSKIGNETIKAELGRAAWKLLHTTMAKFPDKPTPSESAALDAYIHLFARLYPCGECAKHFQPIIEKYPPQTGSRSSAAVWACMVHNEVNKSLGKALFDCSKIGDFYDCGCAEDGEEKVGKAFGGKKEEGEREDGREGNGKIDLRFERMGEVAGG